MLDDKAKPSQRQITNFTDDRQILDVARASETRDIVLDQGIAEIDPAPACREEGLTRAENGGYATARPPYCFLSSRDTNRFECRGSATPPVVRLLRTTKVPLFTSRSNLSVFRLKVWVCQPSTVAVSETEGISCVPKRHSNCGVRAILGLHEHPSSNRKRPIMFRRCICIAATSGPSTGSTGPSSRLAGADRAAQVNVLSRKLALTSLSRKQFPTS